MTTGFAPGGRWVRQQWPRTRRAVALEASTRGTWFTVLCLRIVSRGTALPIAGKIRPAAPPGSGQEPWWDWLQQREGIVPEGCTVVVRAERGWWAKWLFAGIRQGGWHPLVRINPGGKLRPRGGVQLVPRTRLVPHVGRRGRGYGSAFATRGAQVEGTWRAFGGEGHAEAWLILTDWAPQGSDASWDGVRSWIEQFFKASKRGGWQWQHPRLTDAARAARLWLALAVARWWLVRVGGADKAAAPLRSPPPVRWGSAEPAARPKTRRWRLVRVWQRGWIQILVSVVDHRPLPLGAWKPEAWPAVPELPEPVRPPRTSERLDKNLQLKGSTGGHHHSLIPWPPPGAPPANIHGGTQPFATAGHFYPSPTRKEHRT